MAKKKKPVDPVAVGQVFELPVSSVQPAPWNRRQINPQSESIKGLAKSIKEIGQQEPVLVRPVKEGQGWELVYGHRRFAAITVNANGNFKKATIKAVVREMTDEEAKLANAVENLQRESLTEMEEAQQFADFFDTYGEQAPEVLSEKLGITSRYVRKRIAVARLPRPLLKACQKGMLTYSHLEVMLKVDEKKKQLVVLRDLYQHWLQEEEIPSARRLSEWVEPDGIKLDEARFDQGECGKCAKNTGTQLNLFGLDGEVKCKDGECGKCAKNTGTQLNLFGLDGEVKCKDGECFDKKQMAWMIENWEFISDRPRTNAFAFEFERKPHTPLYWREPKEDCKGCESFGTLLARSGKVSEAHVCFGAKECFDAKYLAIRSPRTQAGTSPLSGKPAGPAAAQEDKPRVDWHGESFRQEFYKEQIPLKALELSAEDHAQLLLFVLVKVSSWGINDWLQQRLGLDGYSYSGQDGLLAVLAELPPAEVDQVAKDAVMWLIFNHKDFGDMGRQAVAEFVEVDLNDWSLHEAYLKLKTKKEIVQIILQSGLMQDEAFLRRLRLANVDMKAEHLLDKKKEYLVSMILESGAELRGKLPKEIANTKAISSMTRRKEEPEPETVEDFSPSGDPDLTAGDFDIPTPYDSDWSQVSGTEAFDQTVPEELAVA